MEPISHGLRNCSKRHCSETMCDIYIDEVGYVCTECKSAFKEHLLIGRLNPKTEGGIKKELLAFLAKSKTDIRETTVDDFFVSNTLKL